jgi:hypothetical protein
MIKSLRKATLTMLILAVVLTTMPFSYAVAGATTTPTYEEIPFDKAGKIPMYTHNGPVPAQDIRSDKDGQIKGLSFFYQGVTIYTDSIGYWKLCDTSGKDLPGEYSYISKFSDGVSIVYDYYDETRTNTHVIGFVDTEGKLTRVSQVITFNGNTYTLIGLDSFNDGRAVAAYSNASNTKGEKFNGLSQFYRYITKSGEPASDSIFSFASAFSNGLAFALPYNKPIVPLLPNGTPTWTTGQPVCLDATINPIETFSFMNVRSVQSLRESGVYDGYMLPRDTQYFLDTNGNKHFEEILKSAKGVTSAQIFAFSDGVFGFIDKEWYRHFYHVQNGKETFIGKWHSTGQNFSEGLLAVKDETTNKWGYVAKTGGWAILPQYDEASTFSEGLAYVANYDNFAQHNNKRAGFINTANEIIIPLIYDGGSAYFSNFNSFRDGYAFMKKTDGSWVTIKYLLSDAFNNETTEPSYEKSTLTWTNIPDGEIQVDSFRGIPAFVNRINFLAAANKTWGDVGYTNGERSCVEYVKRFYENQYKMKITGLTDRGQPSGLIQTTTPESGDVIRTVVAGVVHWAIVKEVKDGIAIVIEQNTIFMNGEDYTMYVNNGYPVSGNRFYTRP